MFLVGITHWTHEISLNKNNEHDLQSDLSFTCSCYNIMLQPVARIVQSEVAAYEYEHLFKQKWLPYLETDFPSS